MQMPGQWGSGAKPGLRERDALRLHGGGDGVIIPFGI
jgi:hypothetical protein